MTWNVNQLSECQREYAPGKWGPAKPIAYPGMGLFSRLRDAWLVFRGKAAAVDWH